VSISAVLFVAILIRSLALVKHLHCVIVILSNTEMLGAWNGDLSAS
jgi:hypothetical protein